MLSLVPANTLRLSDLGLLVEQSSSCIALQNRDLTNANWTASNITAAKDQIGPDAIRRQDQRSLEQEVASGAFKKA
jgi:hypothetical protein